MQKFSFIPHVSILNETDFIDLLHWNRCDICCNMKQTSQSSVQRNLEFTKMSFRIKNTRVKMPVLQSICCLSY